MNMTIHDCGSEVRTKLGNNNGVITAVCIRFQGVQYEITYFFQGEYKVVWMNESEFLVDCGNKSGIGFKNL